jgi:pimeloyl-ACP methyl ester carboxylesterase
VCVHGAGSARWAFDLVRPSLEDAFTVISVDRRGRGDSTDGGPYAIERECEDVEAVLHAAGEGVHLFGHSYGALVSAAVLGRAAVDLAGAILYEPPVGGVLATAAEIDAWEERIAGGNSAGALEGFLSDVGGYSPAEIQEMHTTATWERRLAVAPTVPRELRAELAYRVDLDALRGAVTPTLMLVGSESPAWAIESTPIYADAIPNVTVHTLAGHGHGAAATGPDLIAREIRDFAG